MINRIVCLFVALSLCGIGATAHAHRNAIANYQVEVRESGRLLAIDARISPAIADPSGGTWPADCSVVERQFGADREASRIRLTLRCDTSPDTIALPWGADAASATWVMDGHPITTFLPTDFSGSILHNPFHHASAPVATGFWSVGSSYVGLGVWHVLEGWDHLAFVLCVALMFSGTRLLAALTLFTLGHSASLALSFLDVIRVPIAPVEAVIALTVVYMARTALLARWSQPVSGHGHSVASSAELLTIAAFGLIHGLGFASVLGEIGVPAERMLLSLAAFNVGVELGQIIFVVGVLAFVGLLARGIGPRRATSLFSLSAGSAAGGVGLYWTVERALGLII